MYEENRPDQGAPLTTEALDQAPLSSEAEKGEDPQADATAQTREAESNTAVTAPETAPSPDEQALTDPNPKVVDERAIPETEASPSQEGGETPLEAVEDPSCEENASASDAPTTVTEADPTSTDPASHDASVEAPADTPAASGREALTSDLGLARSPEGELSAPSEATTKEQLLAMQAELALLQRQIQQKKDAMERMQREILEFGELYPDHALSELPDDVWESVRAGVPIAAAFALFERRRERTLQQAKESNRENRTRSPGNLGRPSSDFFTAEEVRAMSPSEVHRHYAAILRSMKSWS